MPILKCKMCGGDLNVIADEKTVECEFCGTTQTIPDSSDEKKTNLFNRANRLRMENEFDKAAGVYESIVAEFPEEAEGYWGLVLCSYGIEYVDDAKTGKKIPTCHRTLTSSVMEDENFAQACENADVIARGVYRDEAKAIDKLQQQIISVVENEEPYDVFICYKETDDITKGRTEDSQIAQDIYTELIKEGYKVFFSRVTLRDKAGTEYEPYIYAALKSAKVMLAIGTKYDYYDAVWVKNEWSRYISMMADDSSKHLIPCFKNLDAYDIPKEFKNLQALDMGEVTFFKNLIDNITRIIPKQKAEQIKVVESVHGDGSTVDSLLKRVFMFLEDGDWKSANEYCEKVLDINPECAEAYLGKLLAEVKIYSKKELADCKYPFDDSLNYKKVIRYASSELAEELNIYLEGLKRRKYEEEKRIEEEEKRIEEENRINENETRDKLNFLKSKREDVAHVQKMISAHHWRTLGLKINDTVAFTGDVRYSILITDYSNIVDASVGISHTVILRNEGTAEAKGSNNYGQCNVGDWNDIVSVHTGWNHTVGLKSNGTVVAVGLNFRNQCEVSDWRDIVAISAGDFHTVGIKSDGTVVAVGNNDYGQCDVGYWRNIVAISAGQKHTVGLKSDGTVVANGDNSNCQCNVEWNDEWESIIAVSVGQDHTVGLKSDGTVVAVGNNYYGQCNVEEWTDIVAVSTGWSHTVGLKSDGTVVAVGCNDKGQCNVEEWKLFKDYRNIEEEKSIAKQRISQGLCSYCGGSFKGLFTKTCSNCGKKKDY